MRRRCLPPLLLLLGFALPAAAQVNIPRYVRYRCAGCGGKIEHAVVYKDVVNPYLGPVTDLHLEFPIFTRPTNGLPQLGATLVYDSQFWGVQNGAWTPQAGNGWWLRTNQGSLSRTEQQDYGVCGWTDGSGSDSGTGNIYYFTFTLREPDGSVQNLGTVMEASPPYGRHYEGYYWDCPTGDSLPETLAANDNKGFHAIVNGTYDNVTGTAWDGHGDEVDNGFVDRYGNAITTSGSSYSDPLGAALSVSGSTSSVMYYSYPGPTGALQTITVPYESVYATGSFGCYTSWGGYVNVPQKIEYPDGRAYSFTYDSAGRVATMTKPGGAVVSYSYYLGAQCSPFYITDGLNQSDSLDPGVSWNWTHDTSSNQLIETDPTGRDTVTTFDSSGEMVQQDVHTGAWTNSPILTRTLATGVTSDRTWTTELCVSTTDPCGSTDNTKLESAHTVVLDGSGNVTSTSATDWGVDGPGPVLRQTVNTYQPSGNGEVLSGATVEDAGGSQVARTTFTSFNTEGDPLTEDQYTDDSNYLTTTLAYNSNGTLASVTGPNGSGVSYGGFTCGSGNNIFPQSETTAIGTTTLVWNCYGGVATSATDPNGAVTSTAYDSYWRPISVTAPDGTVTNITYLSASQVEAAKTFNGGNSSTDVVTTTDALDRPWLRQVLQAPGSSNYDSVETEYDSVGRVSGVSMPYTATLGASAPSGTPFTTTSYTYGANSAGPYQDVKVIDAGSGYADSLYQLDDALTTLGPAPSGESPKRKQEQFDGLGQLSSVCEVTAGITGWAGGSCGQQVAATGYLTAYTRNTLGQITGVTQDAQPGNGGEQTRGFAFDQLGRLTSETNPESGTTQFTYNSNGDLATRTDANGNVATYTFDSAHRVTAISYAGPNATPEKHFVYDAATVDNVAMADAKGRLAEAYTGTSGGKITDEGFSYPGYGDEVDLYEQTPHSSGWYVTTEGFYANGAPNGLYVPGLANEIAYSLDGEGRVNGAASGSTTLVNTGGTSYTASGLAALEFGSGDSDSYSYDPNTGRMTQFLYDVGGAKDTGTLGWNYDGQMKSLGITDNIPNTNDSVSCTYTHDDLGRLQEANCGPNDDQKFSYDPFGNHNTTAGPSGLTTSFGFSNNHISGTNYYDADGNLLLDPLLPSQPNAFDADGCPTELEGIAVTCDALDRVVEAGGQEFVYGPGGGKLAVMNGQSLVRADVPLPGGAAAVFNPSGLQYYEHADALGSARLASDPSGHALSSDLYSPYGYDETGAGVGYRSFTGMKQDIDSTHSGGQYDFLAREYNPIQGRWWTPDPGGLATVNPNDPQSWNAYAYVGGTPLEATDPDGLCGNLVIGGSTQGLGSQGSLEETGFASSIGASLNFPFAGEGFDASLIGLQAAAILGAGSELSSARSAIAAQAAAGPGPFTIYAFSGGAQLALTALQQLGPAIAARSKVVGISPGYGIIPSTEFGVIPQSPTNALTVWGGSGPADLAVADAAALNNLSSGITITTGCRHAANCEFVRAWKSLAAQASPKCKNAPSPGAGSASGGGGGGYSLLGLEGNIIDILQLLFATPHVTVHQVINQ